MTPRVVAASELRTDVTVLYVDKRGPYPKLVAEWFDEHRNAETFGGRCPVVAHPPCGPYSRLRALNRYQRPEHALHAVDVVRREGGVLEHPAQSRLWRVRDLPFPNCLPDSFGGWTLEIDQCRFGHVARKRSWIYIVGCSREDLPAIPPARQPTHWCSGGRRERTGARGRQTLVPAGIKVASAQQRRRTPVDFALWLIEVASRCTRTRGEEQS